MKMNDEKEGKSIIDKLVRILKESGKTRKPRTIDNYRSDTDAHLKNQTEEEYQKEQAEWMDRISIKKNEKPPAA